LSEQTEGWKIVAVILALAVPLLLILFGVVDELEGEKFDLTPNLIKGYQWVIIGIAILVVELAIYSYLRNQGKV
jgi:hypothetical protein